MTYVGPAVGDPCRPARGGDRDSSGDRATIKTEVTLMTRKRTLLSPLHLGSIFASLALGLVVDLALPSMASAVQARPSGQAGVTAVVGARIWDGTGAAAIPDGIMLVRDGRITYVGPRGAVPVPAGATVVNLDGRTIIPGMINTHGHVGGTLGPGRRALQPGQPDPPATPLRGIWNHHRQQLGWRRTGRDRTAGRAVRGRSRPGSDLRCRGGGDRFDGPRCARPGPAERGHGCRLDEAARGRQPGRFPEDVSPKSTRPLSTAATSSTCGWLPTSSTWTTPRRS